MLLTVALHGTEKIGCFVESIKGKSLDFCIEMR